MKFQTYKLLMPSFMLLALSACSSHVTRVNKAPLMSSLPSSIQKSVAYDHSKRPTVKKPTFTYRHAAPTKKAVKKAVKKKVKRVQPKKLSKKILKRAKPLARNVPKRVRRPARSAPKRAKPLARSVPKRVRRPIVNRSRPHVRHLARPVAQVPPKYKPHRSAYKPQYKVGMKFQSKSRRVTYSPNLKNQQAIAGSRPVNPLGRIRGTWGHIHRGYRFKNYRYKSKVKKYIQSFSSKPGYMSLLTERSAPYLPTILQEVKRRGIPTEVALLPFVESGFKTRAYSHAHAAGLWQFIPGTARRYGLKVTKKYDARYNWRLSTKAALSYLTDLNRQFKGDWLLSLAAYNCGERRVHREIKRNKAKGLPTDFWHLRLPKETRHYVPRLLAFKAIFSNPREYGIHVVSIPHNPQYRKISNVEMQKKALQIQLQATKRKSIRRKLLRKKRVKRVVTHKVRSGETLYRIARRYGISVRKIKRMNRLKSSRIKIGKRLKIAMNRSKKRR